MSSSLAILRALTAERQMLLYVTVPSEAVAYHCSKSYQYYIPLSPISNSQPSSFSQPVSGLNVQRQFHDSQWDISTLFSRHVTTQPTSVSSERIVASGIMIVELLSMLLILVGSLRPPAPPPPLILPSFYCNVHS
jgi:hypothetical protein